MPLKDPEKAREWQRKYNLRNKEKIQKRDRAYRLRNKEKIQKRGLEYRLRNREKMLAYLKEWKLRNKEYPLEYYYHNRDRILELYKKGRLHRLETDPDFVERERELGRKNGKRQREVDTEKVKARDVLNKAIKAGLLVRPKVCPICGETPPPGRDGRSQIQAHHSDYSRPLDIEWICCRCHALDHREVKS